MNIAASSSASASSDSLPHTDSASRKDAAVSVQKPVTVAEIEHQIVIGCYFGTGLAHELFA